MLRITIFLAIIFSSINASAQIKMGLSASYQRANQSTCSHLVPKNKESYAYQVDHLGYNDTYSIGLSLRKELKRSFLNVDLLFRKDKYKLMLTDLSASSDARTSSRHMNIEESSLLHMPITAGIKLGSLSIGLGPQFSYVLDSTKPTSEMSDIQDRERDWQTGFHFDIAVRTVFNTEFWLRHELSFTEVGESHFYNGRPLKLEAGKQYLSVGCYIYFEK